MLNNNQLRLQQIKKLHTMLNSLRYQVDELEHDLLSSPMDNNLVNVANSLHYVRDKLLHLNATFTNIEIIIDK